MWQELIASASWQATLLVSTLSAIVIWRWSRRDPREPPGPKPLPIVGNYFSIDNKSLDKTLLKWREEYGDVYTAHLGSRKVVVVCGYENIRDILTKSQDVLLQRAKGYPVPFTNKGIIMSNGTRWKESRRFALTYMKDMGLGYLSLQEKVVEEALALCALLEKHPTKVMNLKTTFAISVSNVICAILFGQRFGFDDPEFNYVLRLINTLFAVGGGYQINMYFSWVLSIPVPTFLKPKSISVFREELTAFVAKQVEKHRKTFDAQNPKDFVDLYLKVTQGDSDFDKDVFDETQLGQIIRDLFIAGTETSSTTLLWAILHLMLNQDIQDRCRAEADKVLGRDGIPTLADRSKMPYIEATIAETLRIGDLAPFGLFREVAQDYEFRGFVLKKGTNVLPFLHTVHFDPQLWSEPERFRPERWLDANGNFVRHEHLVTFSLGRRNCLGENVAKTELFLFFTILVQRFRFEIPPNQPPPSSEAYVGATRMPQPYEVMVTRV